MTVEEAKTLRYREVLIYTPDGSRWYVNGKVITWKTRPDEIRVPLKHGLYSYDYLNQDNVSLFVRES